MTQFTTTILIFFLLRPHRAVPQGHRPEWDGHLQLVGQLSAPQVHQDPGSQGGLHLQRDRRPGRLPAAQELQGAGGPGHPAGTLPHCLRPRGGRRRGARRPRDPHAAGGFIWSQMKNGRPPNVSFSL